jgi:aryl-alcohol dehydrogenase-like predicted oxidoreductase
LIFAALYVAAAVLPRGAHGWPPQSSAIHCTAVGSHASRLASDYVDLLLIHWTNPDVATEETLDAFAELKETAEVDHMEIARLSVQRFAVDVVQADETYGPPRAITF